MKSELVKINAESHVKFLQKKLSYQRMIFFLRFHKILKICSAGSHQIFTFLHDLPFYALPIDSCNTCNFEAHQNDRNELQICKNLQKGTGTKMAEKLNNLEKFEREKNQISALFSSQRPSDDWPDALDY